MSIAENLAQIAENNDIILENMQAVYDSGAALYTDWWSKYQHSDYGYEYRFAGYGWYDETFKPTEDMKPPSCMGMFYMFDYANKGKNHDLVSMLDSLGITLSFERAANMHSVFTLARISHLGEIRQSGTSWYNTFYTPYLETIDRWVVDEADTYSGTFTNATALANLTVEGEIGNSISFVSSPLTLESATSVLYALKNYYEDESNKYTKTITFSTATTALLEDAGTIFEVEYSGSTMPVSWDTYVYYMGWNC